MSTSTDMMCFTATSGVMFVSAGTDIRIGAEISGKTESVTHRFETQVAVSHGEHHNYPALRHPHRHGHRMAGYMQVLDTAVRGFQGRQKQVSPVS